MKTSSPTLTDLLAVLTHMARRLGWTDTAWCARAGVRKETLSRLRRRGSCDFATLEALAGATGAQLCALDLRPPDSTADGHFPLQVDRDYEDRLVELCASGTLASGRWASFGPRFFMAGLAVLVASATGRDRRGLLALAEQLHPGVSEPAVFARWLERSPVRPTRFFALLDAGTRHAA